MIEIVIFAAFFFGLVVGALVAEARGSLPSAERLQEEDLERMAQWYRTEPSKLAMRVRSSSPALGR
ncbi:MAG: hypothetical protein ABWZ15_05025 [Acidimicrobiia bacterium]